MLLDLSFPQGVDSLFSANYIRPAYNDGKPIGLFVMNATTGAWSLKFKDIQFVTVSFDGPSEVVGIAADENGYYAYQADISAKTIDVLGRLPTLTSYSLRQGDYTYDPDKNIIYWAGSKGSKIGWVSIDLDTRTISLKQASPENNVMMVQGKPFGFLIPNEYTYPQGVGTFDPSANKAYVPGWEKDGEDFGAFGIIVMKFENGSFILDKFITIGDNDYISNINYDAYSGKFFGERNSGSDKMELIAINLDGDIFTLGTSSGNTYDGSSGDDYYMGLGGNDIIFGDTGNDEIEGGVGNDTIEGGRGLDVISGGEGKDILDGSKDGKKDILKGGAGNDTYIVKESEVVKESSGQGTDTVKASGSYTLGSNLEHLVLIGSTNINGTGNGLANVITGNTSANTLDGGAGNDKLVGGVGNDTLYGGSGADDLYGGIGKDLFAYKTASDLSASKTKTDTIFDFSQGQKDVVDLTALDASSKSSGNQSFSFIGTAAFTKTAGQLRHDKTASDTYVYGDTDGDGKSNFVLHFDDAIKLAKADFLL